MLYKLHEFFVVISENKFHSFKEIAVVVICIKCFWWIEYKDILCECVFTTICNSYAHQSVTNWHEQCSIYGVNNLVVVRVEKFPLFGM